MKRNVQIFALIFLLTGCTSLKEGWNNFNAYYNTFYNAKKFYNAGLKQNRNQLPEINPLQPIRVHPSPTEAGIEDFEKAIEKASGILRSHEDSKFVVPALFIIGKSYYYRSEFFSALEKFQELNAIATGKERQEAVVWLGLTYLEMSNHSQGMEVLRVELEGEENWDPQLEAKAQAVLGELYSEVEDWHTASQYLENSLSEIKGQPVKARVYFLLGQVFERMGELNQALFAYNQIAGLRTDFDMEFHATKKQAEMSREIGNYNLAVDTYSRMMKDDKFIDYRSELQYEVARSLHLQGEREEAIENYNNVLQDQIQPPTDITLAKTYYGLGEVYRDQEKNFKMAAAYFDSAASQRVDQRLIFDGFNATELASSFGEYVSIKQSISEKDSLLNLAEMDPDQLEKFIEELRQQELEKMEEKMDQLQQERDRMLVADQNQEVIEAEAVSGDGFLNIRNQTRLADASLQFQAVWGDRPLADNWRRRTEVNGSRFDQRSNVDEVIAEENGGGIASTGIQPEIDLSNIPDSEEEKREVKTEIETLNYRLGNVFFLSLDMPDSAKVYYKKVIDSGYDENLSAKSMYSVAEIELLSNNRSEAEKWYKALKESQSGLIYSKRIAAQLGMETEDLSDQDSSQTIFEYPVFSDSDTTKPAPEKAEDLIMLAEVEAGDAIRPYLLFDAAKNYMKEAKNQPGIDEEIRRWFNEQREIEAKREKFAALKDSAQTMLTDTTLTEEQQQYWQQIADSVFSEPKFVEEYPFEGVYWDSTRSVLQKIENKYAGSSIMPQVKILRETLAVPEPDTVQAADTLSGNLAPDISDETTNDETEYPACKDLGVNIDMEGGVDAFMDSLKYPSWTSEVSMRGELEYLFIIKPDGSIESYEQLSRMGRSGIPQTIEGGIEAGLRFTPPPEEEGVQCTVAFPFNL